VSQIVAQALVPVPSRLIGTLYLACENSVEMSLDAADTSVCATYVASIMPQCQHRIHRRGPESRDAARQQGDGSEQCGDERKG
jgi:hypothetical protein